MSLDRRSFLKILTGAAVVAAHPVEAAVPPPATDVEEVGRANRDLARQTQREADIASPFEKWGSFIGWIEEDSKRLDLITLAKQALIADSGDTYVDAIDNAVDALAIQKAGIQVNPVEWLSTEEGFNDFVDFVAVSVLGPQEPERGILHNPAMLQGIRNLLVLYHEAAKSWLERGAEKSPQ